MLAPTLKYNSNRNTTIQSVVCFFQGDDLDFWLSGNDASAQTAGAGDVSANGDGGNNDAEVAAAAAVTAVPSVKVSAAEVVLTSEEEDHTPREAEEVGQALVCWL